jgi:ABC-type transport system involved in multi-copper enzyme maturation permease subunit
MYYAELLRARRALIWYGGIFLACVAIGLVLAFKDGPPRIQMSHDANPMIPIGALLVGCSFGPIVLAGFMAVGLDAEFKTAAIAWTRPVSRLAIAAAYVAVDVATLIVAWLFTGAVVVIGIAALGLARYLTFRDASDLTSFLPLVLGCALMWYGLVLLASMFVPGRGNAIVGGSWAYALFVPGLAAIPFPPLLHKVMVALSYLDPLVYLSVHDAAGGTRSAVVQTGNNGALIGGSASLHTLITWAVAVVAVAVGTRIWAVREVPA